MDESEKPAINRQEVHEGVQEAFWHEADRHFDTSNPTPSGSSNTAGPHVELYDSGKANHTPNGNDRPENRELEGANAHPGAGGRMNANPGAQANDIASNRQRDEGVESPLRLDSSGGIASVDAASNALSIANGTKRNDLGTISIASNGSEGSIASKNIETSISLNATLLKPDPNATCEGGSRTPAETDPNKNSENRRDRERSHEAEHLNDPLTPPGSKPELKLAAPAETEANKDSENRRDRERSREADHLNDLTPPGSKPEPKPTSPVETEANQNSDSRRDRDKRLETEHLNDLITPPGSKPDPKSTSPAETETNQNSDSRRDRDKRLETEHLNDLITPPGSKPDPKPTSPAETETNQNSDSRRDRDKRLEAEHLNDLITPPGSKPDPKPTSPAAETEPNPNSDSRRDRDRTHEIEHLKDLMTPPGSKTTDPPVAPPGPDRVERPTVSPPEAVLNPPAPPAPPPPEVVLTPPPPLAHENEHFLRPEYPPVEYYNNPNPVDPHPLVEYHNNPNPVDPHPLVDYHNNPSPVLDQHFGPPEFHPVLEHLQDGTNPNPNVFIYKLIQTITDVAPQLLESKDKQERLVAAPPAGNPPVLVDRTRDLDRLLGPNRQRDDLNLYFAPPLEPKHHEHNDQPQRNTNPVAKLEMQSWGQAPQDNARQPKQEHTDNRVKDLVQLLSGLQPITKLSDRTPDTTQGQNLPVQLSQNPVTLPSSISPVLRNDQAVIPTLVPRPVDISLGQVEQHAPISLFNFNSPILSMARQQIFAEAMSLTGPMSLTQLSGLVGLPGIRGKVNPTLLPMSLNDPLFTGRGIGTQGLIGKDGKIDPILVGINGAQSLDGIKSLVGKDGDRKDITDKKDDPDKDKKEKDEEEEEKDLITLLAATRKVKENKQEDKDEKKEEDEKKQDDQEVRRKYIVREGDTLESIAEKMIGDAKYSLLLEIVNRGYIRYQWEGALRKPLLRVGQIIWLPTKKEIQVHQVLFVNRKDKKGMRFEGAVESAASPAPAAETDAVEIELPALQLMEGDEELGTGNPAQSADSLDSGLPAYLSALRTTGDRSKIKLSVVPSSEVTRKQVPSKSEQSWCELQDILNRMRVAAATGRLPGEGACDTTSDLPLVSEQDNEMVLKQMDSRNRIVVESADNDGKFCLRQEKHLMGEWRTIASYEFSDCRSVRYINKSNGARRAFYVNLPQCVVREMAVKDFSNNWNVYARDYDTYNLRRTKASLAS